MPDQMTRWVALLRGVNVGGANKVPMAELRDIATGLGWDAVSTYIASGNLVFAARGAPADLGAALRAALQDSLGVDVAVVVLDGLTLQAAVTGCPFPPTPGNLVHGFFCLEPPQINDARLTELSAATEVVSVLNAVVWLYAPDGVGRSKLMAQIDQVITGTTFTARNLNTIRKLAQMVAE